MRFFFLLILLASALFTTDASALLLDEAIEAALQNHQRIEYSRARTEQANAAVFSAKAEFMPRLDLNYNYTNRDQDPFQLGSESSAFAIIGSWNLFNGLRTQHSYKAAKHRAQAAEYLLKGTIADIILATKQSYIEVLRASRSVETAREGVELLQRQQHDAELQFEHGLIARNDLLRVEVELSSARQQLLTTEGQLQIARRQIERVTGLQLREEPLSEDELQGGQAETHADTGSYRQEMLDKRSELNYLRKQLLASKRDRSASKGSYLPSIDLSLAHEEYGDTLIPGDLPNVPDNDDKLMLSARWNLFDGFASRSAVASADAQTRAVAAELRDNEAELLLQLETVLQNSRIARGRLQEAKIGIAQAVENYRVTENRFQQQQATTVDLLDAQFLLTRSRNLEINARYDLYLTTAVLERILERNPS
ncbi:MAG: TolC family protein [Desulfuromusa sp.]|jgi:outer membrane protein|nr:TolC family protein [Desulfuromusa sp.]